MAALTKPSDLSNYASVVGQQGTHAPSLVKPIEPESFFPIRSCRPSTSAPQNLHDGLEESRGTRKAEAVGGNGRG